MPSPKVSVCIPSYNHEKYLPDAIDSILAQTYKDIEIVIIDDGSTDRSFEIANSYKARHPKAIKVFTHPEHRNRGISATVNLGFQLSTGEYWSGLPSDDMLHPRKIEEQVSFLDAHPEVGWVYCYAYYIDEAGNPRPEYGLFGEDINQTGDAVEYLLFGNVIPGMTPLMRRSAVAEIEAHDESLIYSDWDFWIRLAAHSPAQFQHRARVMYRMHGDNAGFGSDHKTNVLRGIPVLLKLKNLAMQIGGSLNRPRIRALIELQLSYFKFAVADPTAAEHLTSAFQTDTTLAADPPYFLRWLQFVIRYPELGRGSFLSWVIDNLPAQLPKSFVESIRRPSQPTSRFKAHWQSRRRILALLQKDPEALRDPQLRKLYVDAMMGSRVRAGLDRLLTSGDRSKS